jgi:hypothetical protein
MAAALVEAGIMPVSEFVRMCVEGAFKPPLRLVVDNTKSRPFQAQRRESPQPMLPV